MNSQSEYKDNEARELEKQARAQKHMICKMHGLYCDSCPEDEHGNKITEYGDICKFYKREGVK